jgi:DNA-binding NarL/FixJ family response regulator
MSTVLLIEDSSFFRQLFKETLQAHIPSVEVIEAKDGEEAFRNIESSQPDLIFIDIKLPWENGLHLTKKIKAQYPGIPVVILTSYDLPEYREAAAASGATLFLSKGSATKQHILNVVESILSKQNTHNPHQN